MHKQTTTSLYHRRERCKNLVLISSISLIIGKCQSGCLHFIFTILFQNSDQKLHCIKFSKHAELRTCWNCGNFQYRVVEKFAYWLHWTASCCLPATSAHNDQLIVKLKVQSWRLDRNSWRTLSTEQRYLKKKIHFIS
jgi:hypothetical protein